MVIKLPQGFSWFGKNIGIKDESLDFGGIASQVPCQASGMFTQNTQCGAPVVVGRQHLENGILQAVIVNSKNANVATGTKGIEDSQMICRWVAKELGIKPEDVLPSSTGIIGKLLPMDCIKQGCVNLEKDFQSTPQAFKNFACAIMTTDTQPKFASCQIGDATLVGVVKGSGMIAPNMATMLAYFATDADFSAAELKTMLHQVVEKTLNRVSIDGDTSTSDTAVILSNGLAGRVKKEEFEQKFLEMSRWLSKELVKDGEGVSKVVELVVSGAVDQRQARLTAHQIINSPLVQTAIHGADPNWGRFIMAIGNVSDYVVPIEHIQITFDKTLTINAQIVQQQPEFLERIAQSLKQAEIHIEISLGQGTFQETVWGGDLTAEYVRINSEYST